MCEPDWKGAILGSVVILAQLLTLPILPTLADKYGRKIFFISGRIIELLCYSILMFTTSWYVMLGLMIGFGLTSTTRLTIGITYLVELYPKRLQTKILSVFFSESSLTYIICTVYFWKMGKDWFNFVAVGYTLCILSLIVSFFVPESPRTLFALGRIEEGKKALDFMAKINRMPAFDWDKINLSVVHRCLENQKERFVFRQIDAFSAVFLLEIRDLPPETDLPGIRKMLTRRMPSALDDTQVVEQSRSIGR